MSERAKDGGSASPFDWKAFQPETGAQIVWQQFEGMSLRDWLAGQALNGLLASLSSELAWRKFEKVLELSPVTGDPIKALAMISYEYADRMIAEREKGGSAPVD